MSYPGLLTAFLALAFGGIATNLYAEVLFDESFHSGASAEAKFDLVAPMGGEVKFEGGRMVLIEQADTDGWPHVYAFVNDDGGAPVTVSATVSGGEGDTRFFSIYVRVSEDRKLAYRVDFLIEGPAMMAAVNRYELNRPLASYPVASARGAFPTPFDETVLAVTTENREDGVAILVSIDGEPALEWVDTDPDRLLDGQFFGLAINDNGAREQGQIGPFSIEVNALEVTQGSD